MNKIASLLTGCALLLGATACNEDFNADVPAPLSNAAETQVSFTVASSAVSTIDLNATTADSVQVCSFTPVSLDSTAYEVVIYDSVKIPVSAEGKMSVDTLQSTLVTYFGKRPTARTFAGTKLRCYVYATTSGGSATTVVGESEAFDLVAIPAGVKITDTYTLSLSGSRSLALTHSGSDVYEDPNFTLLFEASAGDTWSIVDADNATLGVTATSSTAGTLSYDVTTTGTLSTAGWYSLAVNMETRTYTIEAVTISPYLWTPGNQNGWSHSLAEKLYSASLDGSYRGFVRLDGAFKFTSAANWSGTNYGAGTTAGTLSTDGGAANLTADAGAYHASVSITDLTYTLTPITQWGIVGSAVGSWDTDQVMTYNSLTNMWEITLDMVAGEYKFRANGAWTLNLGAASSSGKLKESGENLTISTAGSYTISIYTGNDETSSYTIVKN